MFVSVLMQITFGDKIMENGLYCSKMKVPKYTYHHAEEILVNSVLAKAMHIDICF